jgi:DNA mismatch repair protein MutS
VQKQKQKTSANHGEIRMIIDQNKLSPMMKRYFEIKSGYPDCLLFFRLGDFYEMFFDDAVTASRTLDLTLTGRDCGLDERAPMCGVPHHAVDSYIRRLIDAGFRVAICEQLSDPAASKGLVDRDVVRVVSGGTLMEEEILDEKQSNYLCSVFYREDGFGLAWADISTGEFNVYEFKGESSAQRLSDLLFTVSPSECISNESFLSVYKQLPYFKTDDKKVHCYHNFAYGFNTAQTKLCSAFSVSSLDAYECSDKAYAVSAAGGLYEYLLQTQKRALKQLKGLRFLHDKSFMILDGATRRNLELTARARDGKRNGSLLAVLDKTATAMGARELRRFIEQPLLNSVEINARLDAVSELVGSKAKREHLFNAFANVRDLERLAGRLAYGSATPKDLLSISDTLGAVPLIKAEIKDCSSKLLRKINSSLDPLESVNEVLVSSLDRDLAVNFKNGGYIKKGYSEQLDEFRDIHNTARVWLSNLENNEREETGIRTLKIGYNRVFGYYIEVSNSFKEKVPYRYQRKQTLVNGERYITEELKQIEEKILYAESNALSLEEKLFAELKELLYKRLDILQATAGAIACLDALLSFATVSAQNRYVRPKISDKIKRIFISGGRHPVVETLLEKGLYVPNDTNLDNSENRTMIITGPNMAGKSTYMRQVALIVLMAHIGCFVPADEAEIALTDRIFTRIGASDDLSGGQSTFMVEMIEVASILNYATSSSLLILDEIGRGTSTFDGLSIAWAVLEHITSKIKARTLFATHFHELTKLEDLEGVKNYRILVNESGDNIVFLHKIARGGASQSFGIEVASLAGVVNPVIERAKKIMKSLERESKNRDVNGMLLACSNDNKTEQVSLFDGAGSRIEKVLEDTDVNNLTPMQALTVLSDLKKMLKEN